MSILIVGLSAAGKTTIGNILARKLKFKVQNFGTLIEELDEKENYKNYNLNNATPNKDRKKWNVIKKIGKDKENKHIIVDAHMILKDEKGRIVNGFNLLQLVVMKVKSIIVIEADSNKIIARRKNDIRIRNDRIIESPYIIDNDQKIQRRIISELANQLQVKFEIFDNSNLIDENSCPIQNLINFITINDIIK